MDGNVVRMGKQGVHMDFWWGSLS